MARIKVNLTETRAVAGNFEQKAGEIQEIKSSLDSTLQNAYAQWEGMAEQTFMTDYQEADKILGQVPELLRNVARNLKTIADRFEQADTAR